jgi:hypothetical protein
MFSIFVVLKYLTFLVWPWRMTGFWKRVGAFSWYAFFRFLNMRSVDICYSKEVITPNVE